MRLWFTLPTLCALALVAGCGKSEKNPMSPLDPAAAQQEVAAGYTDLAAGNYESANTHFKTALVKDPNNAQANLGAAITEVYLVQNDPDVATLIPYFDGTPALAKRQAPEASRASRTAAALGLLGPRTSAHYDPVSGGAAMLRVMRLAADDPPAISEVQYVVKTKVMPKLAYAEARLNKIEQQPGFVLKIAPDVTGEPDSIEVDLGDILILDSVINGVQGWLGLLVSYNFDVPSYEHVNAESLLAEGTKFATLHPDGALLLANARNDFLTVKTRLDAAVTSIQGETDDQSDDLIPSEALATQGFMDLVSSVTTVYNSLNGSVNVGVNDHNGDPFTFGLYIGRFFTPAIADLKTKFPAHAFDSSHDPYLIDPLTFDDPTINGIFPDMTNARWQLLVGPVGPPPALTQR